MPKPTRLLPKGAKAKQLSALVRAFATKEQIPEARARLWVSYQMLGGALVRANTRGGTHKYVIKGGVALELRLRDRARATKDLDLTVRAHQHRLIDDFMDAIAEPYEGFRFSRRTEPLVMPNGAVRLSIVVQYHDGPWNTIQVDLSLQESAQTNVDLVDAIDLEQLGLVGPSQLPCLSLHDQIAQKLHAMTEPRVGERPPNDRFRDLADVLLLAPLVEDYAVLRAACDDVFDTRATHAWPGKDLSLPSEWREPYEALATSVEAINPNFDEAVREVREFVARIDATR